MLIIMAFVLVIQTFYAVKYRQYWYGSCFCIGIGLEFAGFIARVVSHYQPYTNRNAYLCQIICLTIAPCFIMAALYCILAKLVIFSVLEHIHYTQIFIASDLVTVILLAVGVGLTYSAISEGNSTHLGTSLLVAGLGIQAVSLSIFIILWLIFFWRVHKASKFAEPGYNPRFQHLSSTSAMKKFPAYAFVGIICMYVRAIFKVVEYSEGWTGYLRVHEPYFLGLDGAMVVITGLVMSFPGAYPGIVVGDNISVKKKRNGWVFYEFQEVPEKSTEMWGYTQENMSYRGNL
ncbi:hypothetical protein BABINDRAFT_46518 [Babjeviella inositovora NRRL Y-12698]|uniref:Sphingoid long-chain base transporter RSB1 n=1 Tax=Babjeviella inositovora NRRL Y-12698 TaxID=984486 RepID=A0A1E3QTA1_9ASCO|nr:uncharacterized protein BABINDRAFT_46518 [Babjeviella inositovora NRRL Y-12698]ODQ80933.1 hypothetical protein BABINDRAFT_46518 [Babjeviella inositovora NRRL Y-12698]